MTDQFVPANGIELCYEEFGKPENPSIVLIMGLGTQMIVWPEALCQGLADQGFHVVRFDNRDIGLSEKMTDAGVPKLPLILIASRLRMPFRVAYTLNDMAKDTVGLMDALNIDSAHIVGVSMGGMIGQIVTAKFPKRVNSFTSIMSTSGRRRLPGARTEIVKAMMNRSNNPDQAIEERKKIIKLISSEGYPPSDQEIDQKVRRSHQRNYNPQGYARHVAAIAHSGSRAKLLKKIDRPTLVIHGKADRLVPVECGIDTARLIRDSELKLIEGMGHDLPSALIPEFISLISEHAKQHQR